MAKTDGEDLITQAEAARLRGVTRSAITYLIGQGRLQVHERFGVPFLSRTEVLAYEPQKPGPKPQPKVEAKPAKRRGRKAT